MRDESPTVPPESVLNVEPPRSDSVSVAIPPPPAQIGAYHILGLLGVGGMGEVYKAERRHHIRQTVALKLIKLGFDTREVIARFESERHALARMDHPHIARVLDAGISDTGRPFFVMEYVPGKPITQFCDDNRLSIKDRLLLFTQVCDAIAHAHTKAIIHRDIKAANVLAYMQDAKPAVKVIDFGIAKAVTGDYRGEVTFNTDMGRIVGTYESMSPEQVDGSLDIDTRTDVYSLGTLLYELLAGVKPFDHDTLASAAPEEVKRIIREVEPPRPSARLRRSSDTAPKVAERRQSTPDTLARQLGTELEWIPLKAMHKERARRYESPLELRDDILNYLAGRPLLAGPETRAYRLRKLVKRRWRGLSVAASMMIVLLAGTVFYIHSIRNEQQRTHSAKLRAEAALKQATAERDNARATLNFLTNDVLSRATPKDMPDAKVREEVVRAMILPAAARVGEAFKERPMTEAGIRKALAKVLFKLGRSDLALEHAKAALALHRRVLGDDHRDTIESLNDYAVVLKALGRSAEAEPMYKQALEGYRRVLGERHAYTLSVLNNYAVVLHSLGRHAEAEPLQRQALDLRRQVLGENHPSTLEALHNYAVLLEAMGRTAEAVPLFKQALDQYRKALGEDHPNTISLLSSYAGAVQSLGQAEEALPLYEQVLKSRRRVLGEDHPDTIQALNNYAHLLETRGDPAAAAPLLRQALDRYRRVLGDDHPDTLQSLGNYAHVLSLLGRHEEAEPMYQEVFEKRRRLLGEEHPDTITSLSNYAMVLRSVNRSDEAEPMQKRALEQSRRVMGEDHPRTITLLHNHAFSLHAVGRSEEAEPLFRQAVAQAAANASLGPKHSQTKLFAANHAQVLDVLGRRAEASEVRRQFGVPAPATTRATTKPGRATTAPATRPK